VDKVKAFKPTLPLKDFKKEKMKLKSLKIASKGT
jgi:hypothetical protein